MGLGRVGGVGEDGRRFEISAPEEWKRRRQWVVVGVNGIGIKKDSVVGHEFGGKGTEKGVKGTENRDAGRVDGRSSPPVRDYGVHAADPPGANQEKGKGNEVNQVARRFGDLSGAVLDEYPMARVAL